MEEMRNVIEDHKNGVEDANCGPDAMAVDQHRL